MFETPLKEIVMALVVMGGTALAYSIGDAIRNSFEEATVGERMVNSAGIFSGSVLFGVLICLPLSGYVFDKIREPKIEASPEKMALIRGCRDTIEELNERGFYPKDVNCTELANDTNMTNVRLFKQDVELMLISKYVRDRR